MKDEHDSRNRIIRVETITRVGWIKDGNESRNRIIRVETRTRVG